MMGGSKPSTSSGGDDSDVLARYEKKCIACDSLINNGDNAEYEPLLKAKTLLDDIRVVEKSDEAEQSGEVLDKSKGLQERLDVKLKEASRSWEQAGDAQLEIPDIPRLASIMKLPTSLLRLTRCGIRLTCVSAVDNRCEINKRAAENDTLSAARLFMW